MFERQIESKLLSCLDKVECGSLALTTPDGKVRRFEGRQPGPAADLTIRDWRTVPAAAAKGDIGLTEAYRDGWCDSDDLAAFLVFGLKNEEAPVRPLNHYARTKRRGEELVLTENPDALVGRVSWLFGTEPGGVVESVVRRSREGGPIRAVGDKFSKPTSVKEIGRMTLALLGRGDLSGIFHLTHPGEPESWWSIACKVVALGREAGLVADGVQVIRETMEQSGRMQAVRPVHTAMNPVRLREELSWKGVGWEEEARKVMALLAE